MLKKRRSPVIEYIEVDNKIRFYVLPEPIIIEMKKNLISRIQVFAPSFTCLGIGISFLKDLIEKDLTDITVITYLTLGGIFTLLSVIIFFYLRNCRRRQLRLINKILENSA